MRVRIVMKPFLRENPHQPAITYDISQLFDYIDTLTDLSVLVFDKENAGYSPYNKDWIKVICFPRKIMVFKFPGIKFILGKNLRYAPPPSKRLKLYKQHLICHCGKTLNKKTIKNYSKKTWTNFSLNYYRVAWKIIKSSAHSFFQAQKYPEPIFACPRNCSNKCNVHDRDKKSKFCYFISSRSLFIGGWH